MQNYHRIKPPIKTNNNNINSNSQNNRKCKEETKLLENLQTGKTCKLENKISITPRRIIFATNFFVCIFAFSYGREDIRQ